MGTIFATFAVCGIGLSCVIGFCIYGAIQANKQKKPELM